MARCEMPVPGNTVLAWIPDPEGKKKKTQLIETRGDGGYALLPGCPKGCHETGRVYHLLQGNFAQPPVITQDQFDLLTDMCRAYNQVLETPVITGVSQKSARERWTWACAPVTTTTRAASRLPICSANTAASW